MTRTPALDQVIAHGNRGHYYRENPASAIECADGFRLSVIAGGGTYCDPRPSMCSCAWIPGRAPEPPILSWEKRCDYPGPYYAVEVMILSATERKHPAKGWKHYDAGGAYASVPVQMVRDLIESHGGER